MICKKEMSDHITPMKLTFKWNTVFLKCSPTFPYKQSGTRDTYSLKYKQRPDIFIELQEWQK